jgi:hypothetical protein
MEATTWESTSAHASHTTTAPTKLRKKLREVHSTHAPHAATVHPTVLILTHIVSFTPCRIGEDTVCFDHQLEFLFVTTLQSGKSKSYYP